MWLTVVVFFALVVVTGVVAFFVDRRSNSYIELRDALTGEPLGMTKKQYARYCYCLGTKDPQKIATILREVRVRKQQLAMQQPKKKAKPDIKHKRTLETLQRLSRSLIVLAFVVLPLQAHAQMQPWVSLAYYRFGEGYYAKADYINALQSFKAAYDEMPMPELEFDMALTHWRLDNVYAARTWLRQYTKEHLSQSERARAERLGDTLANAISEDYDAQGLVAWQREHSCWAVQYHTTTKTRP
jgi:tetratricopeptide (TPR) repeat protein